VKESLPAGTTISYYRIRSRLGASGMGEVYLALDTPDQEQPSHDS